MKRHTPARDSALVRALGPDPLVVSISGDSWPADLSSGFSMRRARPSRDPIGEPASCSVTVAVDALPSWQKGDQLVVELSDTALDRLFGSQTETYTNYVPNPALNLTGSTGGWVGVQAATIALADDVNVSRPDTGSKCLQVTCTANGDGVRTSPTAEVAGAERIGPGQPLQGAVWVLAAIGEQVRVRLEHGYSATDPSVVQIVDERTIDGTGDWQEVRLGGLTSSVRNYTPLLRFQSMTGAQTFLVDAALVTVARDEFTEVAYFSGASPNGTADPAGQFFGFNVTHSWTGTPNNSWSTRFVDKLPAIEQARRRFTGRLSDLRLRSKRRGLSFIELIGVGNLARLGGITIGDEPWPAETLDTRANRILTLAQAKGGPAYTLATSSSASVIAKDVDRRGASELLADLAETAGATFGLTELRDGSLLWTSGYADEVPPVAVPASLVPAELEHEQAEVINDVTVTYGGDKPGAGYAWQTNMVTNPSFEVDGLRWGRGSGVLSIARDATVASVGTASLKVSTTAAGPNPYMQTDSLPGAIEGRRYFGRARIRASKTGGGGRILIRFYDAGGALLRTDAPAADVPLNVANGWYTVSVTSQPAPVGTTQVRLLVQWIVASMATTDSWWIDAALLRELNGDETPDPADYFDGSTAASTSWSYGWTGTAHASASERRTTAETPELSIRAIDAASVAAHGRYATTVETQLQLTSDRNGQVYERGREEWLPGGWQMPPLSFDLLQLLDGRADQAFAPTSQGATTATELAAQLARIELGSYLTIDGPDYYPGAPFDVDHIPASSLDVPGRVSTLNESITASRWSINTEQERTT